MTSKHPVGSTGWPAHLRPGALRWARASNRYDETVAFYRDLVELPVVGEFTSSYDEDGTIFGLPDTTVQLEIVRAHPGLAPVGGLDQLVLYLDDADALATATARLLGAGLTPDPAQHPYWEANGAVTFRDPDGRGVVFAPWVYGRVPDPVDRPAGAGPHSDPHRAIAPEVGWYDGDRARLRSLFEEAEDSPDQLDAYLDDGRVLVARLADQIVGHLQLVDTGQDDEVELKNMAVAAAVRGTGIGRALVDRAVEDSRTRGYDRLSVATAAADVGNLRFYQRCGFRFSGIEPDAFGPGTGYADGLTIDGIPLRDRVWLRQRLQD
jgi:ribosomal protein S18 acetylase RimI-like enzyme